MYSSLTPPSRRGGKVNNAMDIESIRARRARLEEMIGMMRQLPPLNRTSSLSSNNLSKGSTPPGNSTTKPTYYRRRRSLETPGGNAPLPPTPYRRLPNSILPLTPMTCRSYVQPLPDIRRNVELESRQPTPRLLSSKRTLDDEDPTSDEDRPPTSKSRMSMRTNISRAKAEPASTEESISSIIYGMSSNSQETRLENTIKARKLLSREANPPIEEFVKAGVLPPLMPLLHVTDNDLLVHEAAWALTNISAGESDHTKAVVNAGAVPILIKLLSHEKDEVKEQAAWALGNITGDGSYYRNLVVQGGVVNPLLEGLDIQGSKAMAKLSLVQVTSWVMSNIFRHKGITMSPLEKTRCIDTLKILASHDDSHVAADALWALNYIVNLDDDSLEEVVAKGVVPVLVNQMGSQRKTLVVPALRALGTIATGNDEQTDTVLDNQALPILKELLDDRHTNIRKDATWTISNITAGSRSQIQRVLDADVLPAIIKSVETESADIQTEAVWAISNLAESGSYEQMSALIDAGAVSALMKVISQPESNATPVSLMALSSLLKVPRRSDIVKDYIRDEGVYHLRSLTEHVDPSISVKAEGILNSVQSGEEEDKGALSFDDD